MRFTKFSFIFGCVLFLILFSCVPKQEEELDIAQIRRIIEENEHKFVEAALQGDAAAAAALCTENTYLLPPNSEMIQGKQATEEFWSAAWSQIKVTDFDMIIVELYGSGDIVYEIGTYNLTIQPEGQEPIKEKGKYLSIWKKMPDGSWKRHIDIWNTSMPIE